MAIYVKLKDQVYKGPDRMVVGRGAPFANLNDDRDVARAHVLLINKKNKIYVKDLNSRAGTIINGKHTKPNKFVQINFEDVVEIGGQPLVVLPEAPSGSFIEVERCSMPVIKAFLMYLYVPIIVAVASLLYQSNKGNKIPDIILDLFTVFFVWFIVQAFVKLYKKVSAPIHLKEIFLSDEGFTIHYSDGQNMTFKLHDIQSWFIGKNGGVLFIRAHDEEYRLHTHGQFLALIKLLECKLLHQKLEKYPLAHLRLVFWAIAYLPIFLDNNILDNQVSIVASFLIVIICSAMLMNNRIRQLWPFPVTKIYSKKKQTYSIVCTGLFVAFLIPTSVQRHRTIALIENCSTQNKKSCTQINFHQVDLTNLAADKSLSLALETACKNSNRSACHHLINRSVAGKIQD